MTHPKIANRRRVAHRLTTLPKGTRVVVTLDDGEQTVETTRSEPWQLGSGQWVVLVTGHSGGYSLDRIAMWLAPFEPADS